MDGTATSVLGSPFPSPTAPVDEAPPDPVADSCHLFGPTALIVQALMGVVVIGALVIKRHYERRKRRWRVWVLDVGKQLVGQAVVHGLNILISSVVADASAQNPCSLYFLNILIDTTIGIGILYLALMFYTHLLIKRFGGEGYQSGQYGHPPQWSYWGKQLQPYLLAIVTMKLIVLLPLTLPHISASLIRGSQSLLSWFNPDAQVIFVLAIFPMIMNVLQFVTIDQLIKAGKGPEDKTRDLEAAGHSDDEDDDNLYQRVPAHEDDDATHRRPPSISGSTPPASPRMSTEAAGLLRSAHAPVRRGSSSIPPALSNLGESVWSSVTTRLSGAAPVTLDTRARRSDAPSPDPAVYDEYELEESPIDDTHPPAVSSSLNMAPAAADPVRRVPSPSGRKGATEGSSLV